MNILFDTHLSHPHQRRILSGVVDFLCRRPKVELYILGSNLAIKNLPDTVDGILRGIKPTGISAELTAKGVPTVNLLTHPFEDAHQVRIDPQAVAEKAVLGFKACHLRNAAYLYKKGHLITPFHMKALPSLCNAHGLTLNVIKSDAIAEALPTLPKPVGVLLPEDMYYERFIRVCVRLGYRVPEDIQIIGINNDVETCLASTPSLSSIDQGSERLGYEGSQKLMRLIEGERVTKCTELAPKELVHRESTAKRADLSPEVIKALDVMHSNLGERIIMDDLLIGQTVSRRSFESRFTAEMECPPMTYLRNVRLERIQFLLQTTALSVKEIGRRCGVPSMSYLCRLFQHYHGMTPQEYRRQPSPSSRGKMNPSS